MRIAALIFKYGCCAFALFLCYQIAHTLRQADYDLMEIVNDMGTILICIDLAVFLHFNSALATLKIKQASPSPATAITPIEKMSRKLGHLGIMLIICSWIVPKLA